MGEGRSFIDNVSTMDAKKAMRLIVYGILIAIIFAAIGLISMNLDANSTSVYNLLESQRLIDYNNGLISYEEFLSRGISNSNLRYWLQTQDIWIVPIARIGGLIAVFLITVSFLSLGLNDRIEEKSRRAYLIIGGIATIFLIMYITGMGVAIYL